MNMCSVESDLPMAQLSELFNVNHFIVSQVGVHFACQLVCCVLPPRRVFDLLMIFSPSMFPPSFQ